MLSLRSAVLFLVAGVASSVAACSSGSSSVAGDGGVSDAGSSGTTSAKFPRVVLVAQLSAGSGGGATCASAGKSLLVGSFSDVSPIEDGKPSGTGTVSLSCSVATSSASGASAFDVRSNVQLSGASGGTLTLLTSTDSAGISSSPASISLTIAGTTFSSTMCHLMSATLPSGAHQGGVAAGRYWGAFTCAGAVDPQTNQACNIDGEIRIEDCAQ